MSKPTPGPWIVFRTEDVLGVTSRSDEHIDFDGDGADICEIQNEGYFGREQCEANARLIAAAPELLEACKDARQWLAGWASAEGYIDRLEAAIAKAEGLSNAE